MKLLKGCYFLDSIFKDRAKTKYDSINDNAIMFVKSSELDDYTKINSKKRDTREA